MNSVPMTIKESKALFNLCGCFASPDRMDMTEEELALLEAKLHNGPTNEFEMRLTEAWAACRERAGKYSVRLDITELGVRVSVLTGTKVRPCRECVLICSWIDIAMCHINPLLSTIDRACIKLESTRPAT